MPLQDISPINDQLADIIVRADEPWIESSPGQAWMKVLWAKLLNYQIVKNLY